MKTFEVNLRIFATVRVDARDMVSALKKSRANLTDRQLGTFTQGGIEFRDAETCGYIDYDEINEFKP